MPAWPITYFLFYEQLWRSTAQTPDRGLYLILIMSKSAFIFLIISRLQICGVLFFARSPEIASSDEMRDLCACDTRSAFPLFSLCFIEYSWMLHSKSFYFIIILFTVAVVLLLLVCFLLLFADGVVVFVKLFPEFLRSSR
jgi:hypothetical protein